MPDLVVIIALGLLALAGYALASRLERANRGPVSATDILPKRS